MIFNLILRDSTTQILFGRGLCVDWISWCARRQQLTRAQSSARSGCVEHRTIMELMQFKTHFMLLLHKHFTMTITLRYTINHHPRGLGKVNRTKRRVAKRSHTWIWKTNSIPCVDKIARNHHVSQFAQSPKLCVMQKDALSRTYIWCNIDSAHYLFGILFAALKRSLNWLLWWGSPNSLSVALSRSSVDIVKLNSYWRPRYTSYMSIENSLYPLLRTKPNLGEFVCA